MIQSRYRQIVAVSCAWSPQGGLVGHRLVAVGRAAKARGRAGVFAAHGRALPGATTRLGGVLIKMGQFLRPGWGC
jgi:hypothetical protein